MALTNTQFKKYSLWGLGGAIFLAVVLAIFQSRSNLNSLERDFIIPQAELAKKLEEQAGLNIKPEEEELAEQKQKDTDGDSLNDFDELYIYGTSPYLKDSDSDGLEDSKELEGGTNPICPEGTECAQPRTGGTGTTTAAEGVFDELSRQSGEQKTQDVLSALNTEGEVKMQELRNQLKNLGITQEMLDQMDDNTLLELVKQVKSEAEQGNVNTSVTAEAENIRNLSTEEKRSLLLQYGFEEEVIKNISDKELEDLFNGAINDIMKQTQIGMEAAE